MSFIKKIEEDYNQDIISLKELDDMRKKYSHLNDKDKLILDNQSQTETELKTKQETSNFEVEVKPKSTNSKKNKKFIRFFEYDDEYISGWTYFSRSILNTLLSLLLIGVYLNSVTAYKRARSLGNNDTATLWGIWGFLAFPLAFTPIAIITNTIPHWYLWFSNGRDNKV